MPFPFEFLFARFYEVTDTLTSPYGIKHEIRGALTGPTGQTLHIVDGLDHSGGNRRDALVTLFPEREVAR
jgi:hypothetical protein